jgi:hypothetical protein
MRILYGLTTLNLCVGRIALTWRWNMRLGEAIHTCSWRRHRGGRGYATAGPLIIEW